MATNQVQQDDADRPGNQPTPAEYVQTDANLVGIGYFDASYKRRKPTATTATKTLQLANGRNIRFVPTLEYGYANAEDLDFLRALETLITEQLERNDTLNENGQLVRRPHLALPLKVSIRELIRRAGREPSARDKRAVRDFVRRSASILIEGDFPNPKTGEMGKLGTHLVVQYYLPGDTMKNGDAADAILIWPAPLLLSDIAYGRTYLIDVNTHRALGRVAIAKTLYPILLSGFAATKGQTFRKSYRDTVTLLALRFERKRSDRERQLSEALTKLTAAGIIVGATWKHRPDDSTVAYDAGPTILRDLAEKKNRRKLADTINRPQLVAPDEAEARAAVLALHVADIIEATGDRKSEANWRQLVRKCLDQRRDSIIHRALSEMKAADVPPGSVDNRGAFLNARLRDLIQQLDLFTESPRPVTPKPAPKTERRPAEPVATTRPTPSPAPRTPSGVDLINHRLKVHPEPVADCPECEQNHRIQHPEHRDGCGQCDRRHETRELFTATLAKIAGKRTTTVAPLVEPTPPNPLTLEGEPDPAPAGARPPGMAEGVEPST